LDMTGYELVDPGLDPGFATPRFVTH
jgi:hypothetical protein